MTTKLLLLLLAISLSLPACGQIDYSSEIPGEETTLSDFCYPASALRVATVYYHADSAGQEPKMLIDQTFNPEGKITGEYMQIFGKNGSETYSSYIYKDGKLDSLNVNVSAKNFNRKSKYYYTGNRLDSAVMSGHYVSHTDIFTYGKDGKISMKETFAKGRKRSIELYNYDGQALAYIIQKNKNEGEWVNSFTWFAEGKKLAAYDGIKKEALLIGTYKTEYEKNLETLDLDYFNELRRLKLKDSIGFGKAEEKFANGAKVLFSIPISATNEKQYLTKWYQIDRRLFGPIHRYVYRKYFFGNGIESGGTDHEYFFQKRVERMGLK